MQEQQREEQLKQQGKKQQEQQRRRGIDIRYIESELQTKTTVLVVDKKFSLTVELKGDTKSTSYEAIGLATYSNSTPTVLSYACIFESLWTQTKLYEQLKIHDKMQKEFIDIAAHELRTPIQPIIGLSQVLQSKIKSMEYQQLLDAIVRNAKRLQELTENILDVTRIESNSLQLNKEQFNLRQMILNAMADCKSQLREYDNVRLEFLSKREDDVFVEADKTRIGQVISNLLNNAIKFTQEEKGREEEGIISVTLEENKKNKEDNNKEVIVSIKDTGTGIAPQIMPRLFTKFATKSEKGTGLGLFISKSIIEAHGGRIWAQNDSDGRGATFSFSLPITDE